jgi:hypothetical protein
MGRSPCALAVMVTARRGAVVTSAGQSATGPIARTMIRIAHEASAPPSPPPGMVTRTS